MIFLDDELVCRSKSIDRMISRVEQRRKRERGGKDSKAEG